jgi:urease accessory protein
MKLQSLARLLQLASPALPVGAYTYSQGLERAVEDGVVANEATALTWIGDMLEWNLARFEAPLLVRMLEAWRVADWEALTRLDADFLASRESAELRAETLQMGYSLIRLLKELGNFPEATLARLGGFESPSYPLAWSGAAAAWDIGTDEALTAYLWGWAENQVMAALKAVPLGQAAGQRILLALGGRLPERVAAALELPDEYVSNFAPGFAIASALHETQYSRLFRS